MDPLISLTIGKVKNLTLGSEDFRQFVRDGVDEYELEDFIRSGNLLKTRNPTVQSNFEHTLQSMFDLGGVVAGGAALSRIFNTHD